MGVGQIRVLACLIFLALPIAPALGETARPAKILLMGFPDQIQLVAQWLEADPMVDPRQVPARAHLTTLQGSDIQRFIRLYFPRTYPGLLEYEYLMLLVVEIFQFTPNQQQMIYDAIAEEGRGAIQDRSVMSTGEWIAIPWAESMVAEAFPNDARRVVSQAFSFSRLNLRYVVNTNPDVAKVFQPYKDFEGVEAVIGHPYWTCIAIPKEGAVITSYIVGPFSQGHGGAYPDPRFRSPGWMPHTMYWEYGNATTWTHHDALGQDLYWDPARNPFSLDLILAEFLFSTGRELPTDVILVHNLRGRFGIFISEKEFIYSLLDFVERFGASGRNVNSRIGDIDKIVNEARSDYLVQAYELSYERIGEAISQVEALRSEAMRLKDRALFWVYFTEWLSVSGALLLAAFALWTLMFRRRLYREVDVTKLHGVDGG